MKTMGVVLFVLAAWFMSVAWSDSVEGKIARPVAVLGMVAGAVTFALGIRRDIIAAIAAECADARKPARED